MPCCWRRDLHGDGVMRLDKREDVAQRAFEDCDECLDGGGDIAEARRAGWVGEYEKYGDDRQCARELAAVEVHMVGMAL